MSYLSDRLQERSTWAGIGALAGMLPLGVYANQTHELVTVAQSNAPAIAAAASSRDYIGLITALCAAIPAVLAIIWPTSKR